MAESIEETLRAELHRVKLIKSKLEQINHDLEIEILKKDQIIQKLKESIVK